MGQSPQNADDSHDFTEEEFAGLESQLDNTQELVWALLDDHISDADFAELEERMLADKSARETYIRCAQMHADLTTHFTEKAGQPTGNPVLGFLGDANTITAQPHPTV